MYVIKSWTRDFRPDAIRRNDYSCYKEYETVIVDRIFFGLIPIKKLVGKPGTFIEGRVVHTYKFEELGFEFNAKLFGCRWCDDFTEVAYIPDTKEEYNMLKKVAKDVIKGEYGNQPLREKLLSRKGYDYFRVQSFVNYLLDTYNLFEKEDFEVCL